MLCLKCGYDMGKRVECPICGYSTEEPKEMQADSQVVSVTDNQMNQVTKKKEKKLFWICGVGLVLSIICLVWVLRHFESTTHIWFENKYNEVFYDQVRVAEDRNAMLAVSNQGILSYEYGGYILGDLKGRKKNISLDLNGEIAQIILSDSAEYIGVITNLQNKLSLNLIKVQDSGNVVIDENIDINKMIYISDKGSIFYINKAGALVCWNNKNKQEIGNKITKCIVFQESNSMYFLQEDKALYKLSLDGEGKTKKVKSNVLSLSAKRINSWKSLISQGEVISFGYLEEELKINTNQQSDVSETVVEDENFLYGIDEKQQLYREDTIDGEITVLHKGVIDFGIR